MRTRDPDITSTQIRSECEKEHGKGKSFFRTDGLAFDERRTQLRHDYLESHPSIEPKYREAMLKGAITPGMTREEVTAAWGLLEEDTRMVFGHVTEGAFATYAYFNGFRVGRPYTLFLKDEFVVGITESIEAVEPHELELTMRLAEEYKRMHYFYPGDDGALIASDVDQVNIDWDTLHLHLYTIETVLPYPFSRIKRELEDEGAMREYELEFVRRGLDKKDAPDELKMRAALGALPYPRNKDSKRSESQPVVSRPIALPPGEAGLENFDLKPPDEWSDYVERGGKRVVAFPTSNGGTENVQADWIGRRHFRVGQVPLRVDDIWPYDIVEVEWQKDEIIPRFKRVIERAGHRVIRAVIHDPTKEEAIRRFAKLNSARTSEYRYEEGLLVFAIREPELDRVAKEWLSYLPLTWMYTDTLTQD